MNETETEADIYRRALIRLSCMVTSGKRKTMDKSEVARIAGEAYDRGNEEYRRQKQRRQEELAAAGVGES